MAQVKITIGAALGPLQSALRKAGGLLRGFAGMAKKALAFGGIGGAIAGALGGAGFVAGLKDAIDLGGKMSDLAVQIGESAGKTQLLAAAFEANGMSAERMAGNINKMQKTLFEASQAAGKDNVFAKLKLDAEELMKLSPAEQFDAIQQGLAGLNNVTERTGVAMQIFGRSGAEMLRLLSDPEAMANARAQLGGMADLMDENATKFDRVSDVLAGMGKKVQGFFVGVASEIIDQMTPIVEWINQLDFAPVGQKIGKAISTAFEIIRSGQIGTLLELSMNAALEAVTDYFTNTVIPAMKDGLMELVPIVGKIASGFAKFTKGVENIGEQIGALMFEGVDAAREVGLAQRRGSGDPNYEPPERVGQTAAREALAAFFVSVQEGVERMPAPELPGIAPPELGAVSKAMANFKDLVTTSFRRIGGEMGGRDLSGMNIEKEQLQVQRRAMESAKTTASHLTSLVAAAIPFYRAGNVAKYA
jgi:hypothetical protein